MPVLLVVNDLKDLPLHFEGIEIVTARAYLTDPRYAEVRNVKVFNLCRSMRYQGTGYYVSLLASARGHKPIPSIATIQDLKSPTIIRSVTDELDDIIQKSFSQIQSNEFTLSIYFGRNLAKRYDKLSLHLFKLFPAPFLRAQFSYRGKDRIWHLRGISLLAASDIPEDHRTFVADVSQEFFRQGRIVRRRTTGPRYDLAILYNPDEQEPPSNSRALHQFVKSAESIGLDTELIEKDDYRRLAEFDALFIRETTSVTNHTYRLSRKAVAEGLVVVDDPESILKCTNKVFLAELLERNRVSTPKTTIVHRQNARLVSSMLGLPCILKKPDSSFSQGVVKVENEDELKRNVDLLLESSDLIIAQEYLETPYDWRIGIFDYQPLYVCRYYMAKNHWQIIKRNSIGLKTEDGRSDTIPLELAPPGLIRLALRAGKLIGDGFYGVDIKQIGKRYYLIEINDNPSIDAGVEDAVSKSDLYLRIMRIILKRIELRKQGK